MTVTAYEYGETIAFGILHYTPNYFRRDQTTPLPIADDIYSDVSATLHPTPQQYSTWLLQWYANMYTTSVDIESSKFASAITKLEYGVVNFAYKGQATNQYFWNFSSQRFPLSACWAIQEQPNFPSPMIIPTPIGDATLRTMSGMLGSIPTEYATQMFVRPTNAAIETTNAYIFYQAYFVTGNYPVSFGEF